MDKTKVERTALVAYSAQQMFDLVNNIEAYPDFMEGCESVKVLSRDGNIVEAKLDLHRVGMHYSFTTRNALHPPHKIEIHLLEGPFRSLEGQWNFTPLAEDACKTSLELEFEFKNKLIAMAANRWFEAVANTLVSSICQRADTLYAKQ